MPHATCLFYGQMILVIPASDEDRWDSNSREEEWSRKIGLLLLGSINFINFQCGYIIIITLNRAWLQVPTLAVT